MPGHAAHRRRVLVVHLADLLALPDLRPPGRDQPPRLALADRGKGKVPGLPHPERAGDLFREQPVEGPEAGHLDRAAKEHEPQVAVFPAGPGVARQRESKDFGENAVVTLRRAGRRISFRRFRGPRFPVQREPGGKPGRVGEKVGEPDLPNARVGRREREDLRGDAVGGQVPLLRQNEEERGRKRLGEGGDVEQRRRAGVPGGPLEEDLVVPADQQDRGGIRPLQDPFVKEVRRLPEAPLPSPGGRRHPASTGDSIRKRRPFASIRARTPNGRATFLPAWPAGKPYRTGTVSRFPASWKTRWSSSIVSPRAGAIVPTTIPENFESLPDWTHCVSIRSIR